MLLTVDKVASVGKGVLALASTASEDARLFVGQVVSSFTFDSNEAFLAIQPAISAAYESPHTTVIAACAGAVAYPACCSIFSAIRSKRKRVQEENMASPKKARTANPTSSTVEVNSVEEVVSKEDDSIGPKVSCTNEGSCAQEQTSEAQIEAGNNATTPAAAPAVSEEKKIHERSKTCVGEKVTPPIGQCAAKPVICVATRPKKKAQRAPEQPKPTAVLVID